MPTPVIEQIARHCHATLAMLPYASVEGLGSLDIEVLAAIFGQTMRVLNELPDMARLEVEETFERATRQRLYRDHRVAEILSAEVLALKQIKKSEKKETQREYWRRKKQEERARKRN